MSSSIEKIINKYGFSHSFIASHIGLKQSSFAKKINPKFTHSFTDKEQESIRLFLNKVAKDIDAMCKEWEKLNK